MDSELFLGEVYFATVSRTGHRERGTSLKVQIHVTEDYLLITVCANR